jgi:hypothetical protein
VKARIMNDATGSSGLLDPGASFTKLILNARLLRDLFSLKNTVLKPIAGSTSSDRRVNVADNKPCFPSWMHCSETVFIARQVMKPNEASAPICVHRESYAPSAANSSTPGSSWRLLARSFSGMEAIVPSVVRSSGLTLRT